MSANLNITKIKVGQNADQSKNFLISTPTPEDGTLTIEREDGTDVMTVDAAGVVSFPGNFVPAFSASQETGGTLTANVATKFSFQTVEFDTTNAFDGIKFQPQVSGFYQASGAFLANIVGAITQCYLYKNGSVYKNGSDTDGNANQCVGSWLVYLNGTSDYIEFWGLSTVTGNNISGPSSTYFQAILVGAY